MCKHSSHLCQCSQAWFVDVLYKLPGNFFQQFSKQRSVTVTHTQRVRNQFTLRFFNEFYLFSFSFWVKLLIFIARLKSNFSGYEIWMWFWIDLINFPVEARPDYSNRLTADHQQANTNWWMKCKLCLQSFCFLLMIIQLLFFWIQSWRMANKIET